jgi:prepilin-type N-terminal cleavage/methylation domain-containing protein
MGRREGRERTRTWSGNRGFTLVELMVVVLLLGFILLLTFPNFRDLLEPGNPKRAVLQLVGSLKYARSQAATSKQRHRLNLDLKESAFWISREESGGSFQPDPSPMGKPSYLPPGILFLDVSSPERGKMREGTGYVEFSPTGWAEECAVHLQKGEEEVFTVFVHPLGGKVEVFTGYLER